MNFYLEVKDTADCGDEVISFQGSLLRSEIEKLKLNHLESALLNDSVGDSKTADADYLLVLEMLFRRNAEQATDRENIQS